MERKNKNFHIQKYKCHGEQGPLGTLRHVKIEKQVGSLEHFSIGHRWTHPNTIQIPIQIQMLIQIQYKYKYAESDQIKCVNIGVGVLWRTTLADLFRFFVQKSLTHTHTQSHMRSHVVSSISHIWFTSMIMEGENIRQN